MLVESEKVEFKRLAIDELYKTVIAFANSNGGKLLIGVDDTGKAVGIENIDEEYTRITNSLRDAIAPDITMFLHYRLLDNNVISVEVAEGTAKPYYIKAKGLKPAGVYVRQGASSVPASSEQIRSMIKNTDGDCFESARSLKQQLTFAEAENIFLEHNLPFTEESCISLGLKGLQDRLYTNLALLISDQCPYTIKVAVFADNAKSIFKAHKEFSGSVFKQLEDAFDYILLSNQNKSVITGLQRIDSWAYPVEALREALLNSLIHRDYTYSGSIIINITDEEMEFISLGGLGQGLELADIKSGISLPRNKNLAALFHRLGYVESFGTGIRRIYALYFGNPWMPNIQVTEHTYKIILPNRHSPALAPMVHEPVLINSQWQTVLDYLNQHGAMDTAALENLLQVKRTRAYLVSKEMADAGLIKIVGRGVNKRFYRKK